MAERHFAFATSTKVGGITSDDQLLARELERRGHRITAAVWNEPSVEWWKFDDVIVRSTWDYHLRVSEFIGWINAVEKVGVRLWNPPALMRWNSVKAYLRELNEAGVPTVPTRWVSRHEAASLGAIVNAEGWSDFVVKPQVSASAHNTWRGSKGEVAKLEDRFRATVEEGDVLVQPFIREVTSDGEWSLLFYGGEFSHAVIKRPKPNDFRVQREHGGSSESADAPNHVVDGARAALKVAERLHGKSAYARVDGCVVGWRFVLMELELIEPDLFLRGHPDAPRRLADALDL
jgi:hypothetical protein